MRISTARNGLGTAVFLGALAVLFPRGLSNQGPSTKPVSETIILTKGLVISFPAQNCRSVLPFDPVEYRLITGKWSTPRAGDVLPLSASSAPKSDSSPSAPSTTTITAPSVSRTSSSSPSGSKPTATATWEPITANNQGWFEHKALGCGYVYLTYDSPVSQVLLLEGFSHDYVCVNGEPRVGNRYGQSDSYESWQPRFDFSALPVRLKRGRNEFLFKCARGRLKVRLRKPARDIFFNPTDVTAPDLIVGEKTETQAAIVVVNASGAPLGDAFISAAGGDLDLQETPVPEIRPLSVRKIAFPLKGKAPSSAGDLPIEITLWKKSGSQTVILDKVTVNLRAVNSLDPQKRTYVSSVDGSVQHYAVLPAQHAGRPASEPAALVLTLHGAGVEALNQVRSYSPKTWAHIAAPTNRRPYGFNWEDWGRLDALAVLIEAQKVYKTDPSRIYLTGHSMGGHGAWSVGGLFPDLFGAIGPSAGWISFWSYKVRYPADTQTAIGQMVMRAFLPSDPAALLMNYRQHGVYILHGEKDDNVPVTESRQMAADLAKIHKDFIYHEQPGAGHWWDASPEAGTDCVDWLPLFDFFGRHARPGAERAREIEFVTPCPGISASSNWLTIEAQVEPLKLSSVRIMISPADGLFSGTTTNVARLSFDLSTVEPRDTLHVELDGQKISDIPRPKGEARLWLARKAGRWEIAGQPSASPKGPHRYGLFKDAFKNGVILVFGTHGTAEENAWAEAKARYDAETFWYQGNGSIDVLSDKEFALAGFPDRNVVLYGHADMNAAWRSLLDQSPVQVGRGKIMVGGRTVQGKDLGCLFIRPRPDSDIASVGVVAGTGIAGLRLTNNLPYLYAGSSFPDLFIARPSLFIEGISGIEAAGFFGPDWRVESGDFAWK